MKKAFRPTSGSSVKLSVPCRACHHTSGLTIIRFDGDAGFIRCGRCDSPLYSVAEKLEGGRS